MLYDLGATYNIWMFDLIIRGECVKFNVIQKIDVLLIISLIKELDFIKIYWEKIFETVI